MTKNQRPRCQKRVFTGARWDTSGHQCGNYARPGSGFCRVHDLDAPNLEVPDSEPAGPPTVTSSQSTTWTAALAWEAGLGPVVSPPYRKGLGFIARATATARTGSDRVDVSLRGVMRKMDGTPGQQSWDASYGGGDRLPADLLNQLLDALAAEQGAE